MTAFVCRTCGIKGKTHFYSNAKYQCKKCWNQRTYKSGIDKVNKLKSEFGGRCGRCGYDKCLGALEFHHIEPTVKEFTLGHRRGLSEEALRIELSKCELVCANCHREIHSER